MNEKTKEKLIDLLIHFIAGYITFSLVFAFLLLGYELIIGPLNNVLFPQITVLINQSNINSSESQTFNQALPIPFNQFIETELILVVPSIIILGLIYHEAKDES